MHRDAVDFGLGDREQIVTIWRWLKESGKPGHETLNWLQGAASASAFDQMMERIHLDDQRRLREAVWRALSQRTGFTEDYRLDHIGEKVRWLRTTATCVFGVSGEVLGLIGATIDITDAKECEKAKPVSVAMLKVLRQIERHSDRTLSLRELGRLCGLSPRSIHNHFVAEGTTPNRYIKSTRLKRARDKLLDPDGPSTVTAIALQCRFLEHGTFCQGLSRRIRRTPFQHDQA